jgi:hypothetical protein
VLRAKGHLRARVAVLFPSKEFIASDDVRYATHFRELVCFKLRPADHPGNAHSTMHMQLGSVADHELVSVFEIHITSLRTMDYAECKCV